MFENKEALLIAVLQRLLLVSQPTTVIPPIHGEISAFVGQMVSKQWAALSPEVLVMMRVVWSEALINRKLGQQYLSEIIQPATKIAANSLFEDQVKSSAIDATIKLPKAFDISSRANKANAHALYTRLKTG